MTIHETINSIYYLNTAETHRQMFSVDVTTDFQMFIIFLGLIALVH